MTPRPSPLRPRPLIAAMAAFVNVDPSAIRLDHDTRALRKAVGRAVRAYRDNDDAPVPRALNDNVETWPTMELNP